MKISTNWLNNYIRLTEKPEEIAQLLTQSGLEVASITHFETIKGGLKGLVIGEVMQCVQHPNADNLKLTQVNIGRATYLNIVCGAPNVAAGQKVVVAPVGTVLYDQQGVAQKIKKVKIRGEVSEGMLCAEDEIGLEKSHAGILVLKTSLDPGTPATAYFNNGVDTVLEIDLTPNRGDACSHVGVVRELSALLSRPIQYPTTGQLNVANQAPFPIQIEVLDSTACPRYTGVVIHNVAVQPSPNWMQDRLRAIGIVPTNNIVDITNFVLHELGQPLHAFDYDQILGQQVTVQRLAAGTEFVTLDNRKRILNGEELMICDQQGAMCMAGVLGGKRSSVQATTQHLFLESACFAPSVIRKAAKQHGIKTDASFRYERGVDPNLALNALRRACHLIQATAGGTIAAAPFDYYPQKISPLQVEVHHRSIERLIGVAIPLSEIKSILEKLTFTVVQANAHSLTVAVPSYRTDIVREVDIIEEILRIYGYDRIPVREQLGSTYLAEAKKTQHGQAQTGIAATLVANGYYEICTNSITSANYVTRTPVLQETAQVTIVNPLSEALNAMRQTLLFSGLEVISYNLNRKQTDLKLFEWGKTYQRAEANNYTESDRLGIWITGNTMPDHWLSASSPVAFQDINAIVYTILYKLGIVNFSCNPTQHALYKKCVQITYASEALLTMGLLDNALLTQWDIDQPVFFADIAWEALVRNLGPQPKYQPMARFPLVKRDLSLVLDKHIAFEAIKKVIIQQKIRLIQEISVFDVYKGTKLPTDKKAYALRFVLQDRDKTLNEKAIDKVMKQLIHAFETQLGATIRV